MNFEKFIAGRLKGKGDANSFTRPIINIAIWGIALGVMVMILTLGIVKGFQNTVSDKVMSFNSHLQISKISQSDSYESKPINAHYNFVNNHNTHGIKHIQSFASKAGIVKADQDIHGIVLKGIGADYKQDYIESCLLEGDILEFNSEKPVRDILISQKLSQILGKKVGEKITIYFITTNKKNTGNLVSKFQQRKYPFTIKGIYNTGLSEDFDNRFMICDIHYIRKLNYWDDTMVGGYEILLEHPSLSLFEPWSHGYTSLSDALFGDYEHLENIKDNFLDNNFKETEQLRVETIEEKYPQIFDWLNLFDTHIIIIVTIIIIISVINMSAVLLIQLIEKTSFIGLLKSLGASSKKIQRIFLFQSLFLVGRGILIGNILGLGLCVFQYYTHSIPLDESVYYIDFIPVDFNWPILILINIITVLSCFVVLIIPAKVIAKISPAKSIRFN